MAQSATKPALPRQSLTYNDGLDPSSGTLELLSIRRLLDSDQCGRLAKDGG